MAETGHQFKSRIVLLALTGTMCLSLGIAPRPARAAGCHVPERPVLAHTLSWERLLHAGLTAAHRSAGVAPPAIIPLPCQGEVPTLPSTTSQLLVADRAACRMTPPPALSEPVFPEPPATALPSLSSRLDRPPRSSPAAPRNRA